MRARCGPAAASSTRRLPEVRSRNSRRPARSEEHTSELQSRRDLVCRLLLEKKKIVFTASEFHSAPGTLDTVCKPEVTAGPAGYNIGCKAACNEAVASLFSRLTPCCCLSTDR